MKQSQDVWMIVSKDIDEFSDAMQAPLSEGYVLQGPVNVAMSAEDWVFVATLVRPCVETVGMDTPL